MTWIIPVKVVLLQCKMMVWCNWSLSRNSAPFLIGDFLSQVCLGSSPSVVPALVFCLWRCKLLLINNHYSHTVLWKALLMLVSFSEPCFHLPYFLSNSYFLYFWFIQGWIMDQYPGNLRKPEGFQPSACDLKTSEGSWMPGPSVCTVVDHEVPGCL